MYATIAWEDPLILVKAVCRCSSLARSRDRYLTCNILIANFIMQVGTQVYKWNRHVCLSCQSITGPGAPRIVNCVRRQLFPFTTHSLNSKESPTPTPFPSLPFHVGCTHYFLCLILCCQSCCCNCTTSFRSRNPLFFLCDLFGQRQPWITYILGRK